MARIAVVGSVAQDEVVSLAEPLAPGHHVEARGRERRLGGGAANTAIPLRHAGHDVFVVCPVGTDEAGDWLLAQLCAAGLDTSAVVRVRGESTRSLVLVDPDGERTIVNVRRCREEGPPERLRHLEVDAVYVRSRETGLAGILADVARHATVVAHVPPLDRDARPAHVLLGSQSDLPSVFLDDPWETARGVAGSLLRWVVVTRGPQGAEALSAEERIAAPAPAVKAVDTTGAGDVFAAGLVHAWLAGRPMASVLEAAVAWGATAVGAAGLPGREAIASLR
jgi:sugar/nucleoside kinase (ribokinase family)